MPPAVILDIDETILDNSGYQAWMTMKGTTFDPKTWNAYVNSMTSLPIPGAVEFARYADSKGVRVFYISNRTAEEEARDPEEPRGGSGSRSSGPVNTVLAAREQLATGAPPRGPDAPSSPRDYRVLLNVGDNFGDFVDEYRGTEAERLAVLEQHQARWGREWIMLANPSYGSFESAPFKHDFKLSDGRRKAKREALSWPGPLIGTRRARGRTDGCARDDDGRAIAGRADPGRDRVPRAARAARCRRGRSRLRRHRLQEPDLRLLRRMGGAPPAAWLPRQDGGSGRPPADQDAPRRADRLQSCHTALVEGYVVEGHVPADLIERLLRERPKVAGLAVPGMPVGSPGMEVPGMPADRYRVLTFDRSGKTEVFATR